MRISIPGNLLFYFTLLIVGFGGASAVFIWPGAYGLSVFMALAGLAGFGVALNIFLMKRKGGHLVCPVGSNCDVVVTSKYGVFLGVPLERLGMLYYGIILLTYGTKVLVPGLLPTPLISFVALLTIGAFFFSLYLLTVQAFLLRQWCIWCLLSAMLSITIASASVAGFPPVTVFIENAGSAMAFLHSLGFVLGIGTSTAAAFLFFAFLRDFVISDTELSVLKNVSELAWLGLALSAVTHLIRFFVDAASLASSSAFLVASLALFVVIVSGAFLLIILSPFLIAIPFREKPQEEAHSLLGSLRRPIFINGAIALASWYFAFAMDFVPPGLPSAVLLAAYVAALSLAVACAFIVEYRVRHGKLAL